MEFDTFEEYTKSLHDGCYQGFANGEDMEQDRHDWYANSVRRLNEILMATRAEWYNNDGSEK